MDQNLLTNSDLSVDNNLNGEYKFLKALRLIEDDDEIKIGDDDANDEFEKSDDTNVVDEIWTVNDDTEKDDDDDKWWDSSKLYTR